MKLSRYLFFIALISYSAYSSAQSCDFLYKKTITIDNNQVIGNSNHINFPVLIQHTDPDLRSTSNGGYVENNSGFDIAFSDLNYTPFDYEIEAYDPVTGSISIWVRIPSLPFNVDYSFYILYGNPTITVTPSSSNVWNVNYMGIWHLNEQGNSTANEYIDATSNNHHGTGGNGIPTATPNQDYGKIHIAQNFDGNDDEINIPHSTDFDLPTHFTISAWVWLESLTSGDGNINPVVSKQDNWNDRNFWLVHWNNNWSFRTSPDANNNTLTSSLNSTPQDWVYLTVTADGNFTNLYINGVLDDTNSFPSIHTQTFPVIIGRERGNNRFFHGLIDEVRISNVDRGNDWITTEFNNQNDPLNFYSYGIQRHNIMVAIYNDSIVSPSCITAKENIAWESLSEDVSTGNWNSITKVLGTNDWNTGGVSHNRVGEGGYLQTIVNETNTNRMIGLNAMDINESYTDIDYAFYLQASSNLTIYENGTSKGTWGSYSSGDTLRISVIDNEVRYIQNGNIIYTSLIAPTLPLFVDVSLNTVGSTLENITISNGVFGNFKAIVYPDIDENNVDYQWKLNGIDVGINDSEYSNTSLSQGDTLTCVLTPPSGCLSTSNTIIIEDFPFIENILFSIRNDSITNPSCSYAYEEVAWQSISGLTFTSGTNNIAKASGTNNWDAGGFSYNKVEDGGFMETVVNESNTNRMIGLNANNVNVSYTDIDYAFYLQASGNLTIYENGTNKGTWGSYSSGDTLRILVIDNEVRYIQNGSIIYTSLIAPTLPLFVDMSLNTVGSTLESIYVNNTTYGIYTAFVSGVDLSEVNFQWKVNGINVGADQDTYTNTSLIEDDELSCVLSINNTFGCAPDTFITSNLITIGKENLNNNVLFSIRNDSITNPSCSYAYEEVAWQSISGLTFTSGTNNITKASGANNWDAGGFSYNKVEDGGFIETVVNETNTNRMIGLNANNVNVSYTDIDYAFYLQASGNLTIYENGTNKGTWGSYSSGDTLRILLIDNEVRYIQNGNIVYTSLIAPTLPLFVDVSLNTVGSTLENIYVNNTTYGIYTAFVSGVSDVNYQWKLNGVNVGGNSPTYTNLSTNDGDSITCDLTILNTTACSDTIQFSNKIIINKQSLANNVLYSIRNDSIIEYSCLYANEQVAWQSISGLTFTSGTNNVAKINGTNDWNVGGFSYNQVKNGGFMQTIVNETNTNRMIGLNANNTNVSYTDIDYAFYLQAGGNLTIYESGTNKGTFGIYSTGDTLRIAVTNNTIRYYKNSGLIYTSSIIPSFPLHVDMSLNTVGATLENITVYNGLFGDFSAFVSGTSSISYQWKLNGVNVGADSPNYSNYSLNDGDQITSELSIIGSSGCGSDTIIVANDIEIKEVPFDNFIIFYITKEPTNRNGCQYAVENVSWESTSDLIKNNNNISKTSGSDDWNTGAFSYNSINSNGFFQFVVSETNTNRMIGLNTVNTSFSYTDIDYAFYLQNTGNLLIFENGANRGVVGTFSTNDTLRIDVSNNIVNYLKNNTIIYTSAIAPTLPLFVDLSINHVGGTFTEVQVGNATHSNFRVVADNIGYSPTYQWKLNGVNVGANSPTYSNDTLKQWDEITCEVTPDFQNCSATNFISNKIIIKDNPPINFIPSFTPTSSTWLGLNTNWYDANNWSNGVPRSGYNALIPASLGNYPVIPNRAYLYSLDIANGATITLNNDAHLSIYNEWSNAGSFNPNIGLVEFKTCVDTSRWNSSNIITLYDVKVNNNKGLVINNGNLHISDSLIFQDGIIYNNTNEIIFEDNSSWKWASDTSHIDGKTQKTGDDSFIFPVGDEGNFRPIAISAPANVTDHFTAEYIQLNPDSVLPTPYDRTLLDITLNHVSGCEYWILDRTNGSSDVYVTLSWNTNSCGVTNLSELAVARWNGALWRDHGNGGTTGNTTSGTVTSVNSVNSFNPFTLASTTTANPLPISLISFNAILKNNTTVELTWTTSSEINNDFFTIERSVDADNWEEIITTKGAGNSNQILNYLETDFYPLEGISYYRLKQTDFNGKFEYFNIVPVKYSIFTENDGLSIFPNPVQQGESISVNHNFNSTDKVLVVLRNALGQEFYSKIYLNTNKNELIGIPIDYEIPTGIYFITATSENKIHSKKIIIK